MPKAYWITCYREIKDPAKVAASYNSPGGTGTKATADTIAQIQAGLAAHAATLSADSARVSSGYEACREIASQAHHFKDADDIARIVKAVSSKHKLLSPQ